MIKRFWILGPAFIIFLLGRSNAGFSQGQRIESPPAKPIKSFFPDYPESLREERIAGEVVICVIIDAKGGVQWGIVARPLQPDLDKLALEAVKQWTFEPTVHKGSPIPVPAYIAIRFAPPFAPLPAKSKESDIIARDGKELLPILARCENYCRHLAEAALSYTCQETVRETEQQVEKRTMVFNWTVLADGSMATAKYDYPALGQSEKRSYVNDYQLINKNGRIVERRTLMEENGRTVREAAGPAASHRAFFAKPILAPIRLLGRDRQPSFVFKKAGEGTISDRNVMILEARPKPGTDEEIREARIWADPKSGQILRIEMKTCSVEGCEWIQEECAEHLLTPHFIFRHDFGFERKGVLFPSRSEVRVEYSGLVQPPRQTKADGEIQYRDYRFFTVETENAVIR